jgi:hypothetical protein
MIFHKLKSILSFIVVGISKKIEQGDKVFESVDIKAFNITPDNIDILLKTELSKHNYSHAQNKIVNDELRTAMG